jgi:hypothetical protein
MLAAAYAGGARRASTAAPLRPVATIEDLAERAGGAAGHLPVQCLQTRTDLAAALVLERRYR